jgi:hypothetical protein
LSHASHKSKSDEYISDEQPASNKKTLRKENSTIKEAKHHLPITKLNPPANQVAIKTEISTIPARIASSSSDLVRGIR